MTEYDGLRRRTFNVVNLNVQSGLKVSGTISGAAYIQSDNINAGSLTYDTSTTTYGESKGTVINNIPAAAIISGGMWVTGSSASGTTANVVAKPGPAAIGQPLGICLATTASGSNPNILVRGFYQGLKAGGTIAAGGGISAGSGGALNTALAGVAGKTRGVATMGASSGGTIAVYLW